MMHPISQERAEFIQERLKVINSTRKMLVSRQAFYVQTMGVDQHVYSQTHMNLRAEELALYVEYDVLKSDFDIVP